jgi:predicted transcriptional regulator
MLQPLVDLQAHKPQTATPTLNASYIREVIKIRRMRENHFEASMFADPAWDILLDLLAARLENKSVSVSSLCIAAAVPATTALRWITGMTENGMLLRRMDPKDARRVFIELSEDTAEKLQKYFADVWMRGRSME